MSFDTRAITTQEQPPTKLLGTAECLRLGAELTARENAEFGPDFEWSRESTERWLHSGSMFYAAITSQTLPHASQRIVALTSVLLTGSGSSARLLRGEITEQQLLPWFLESLAAAPVLYFSSVLSDGPQHLAPLYHQLLVDLGTYMEAHQLSVSSGLTIALGSVGLQHLTNNGFVPLNGARYLQKYQFMHIDGATAKTEFWRRLLGGESCLQTDPAPSRRFGGEQFPTLLPR